MKYWIALPCLLQASLSFAINPVDAVLVPQTGLPAITQIGNQYTVAYTVTNNVKLPMPIRLTGSTTNSGFASDGHCANVTLSPKDQPGSSCTTYVDFIPTNPGAASYKMTLQYHNNVIPLTSLNTQVSGACGTTVYPSNTGIPVATPIINSSQVWSFVSASDLHPMKVNVSSYVANLLAPGLIFNAPYATSGVPAYGQNGALILDNDGNPVWFRPLSSPSLMNMDVKVQTLDNQQVLTFWQGTVATPPTYTNVPAGSAEPGSCYYILDNSYRILNTVSAFYDFIPDVHEFLITPNNTFLFLATKVIPMDLTPYGGPKNGSIQDYSIQEVDIATNKLIFFWDAIAHIPLNSTFLPASTAVVSNNVWDPYHLNSIGLISDNLQDLLISGRNTWTIYRLNKPTGQFVWRLVGDGSGDFAIPNPAARFAWQHDVRYISSGMISLFDDECCANPRVLPPGTVPSHGLILNLDLGNHIASTGASYFHNPNLFASSQGNNQILSNNNRFMGFGSSGYYTEYAMRGNTQETSPINILYDAKMPGGNASYRSVRQVWVGMPYYPPSLAVQTNNNQTFAYASWNGATEVHSWQVYAGLYSDRLSLVGSAMKNGFETAIPISKGWSFFQVKALNSQGKVIGTSRIVFQQT
ncbi:MAG: arylsulfotransferase family protein [Gammaproteobacteria bacterium]